MYSCLKDLSNINPYFEDNYKFFEIDNAFGINNRCHQYIVLNLRTHNLYTLREAPTRVYHNSNDYNIIVTKIENNVITCVEEIPTAHGYITAETHKVNIIRELTLDEYEEVFNSLSLLKELNK